VIEREEQDAPPVSFYRLRRAPDLRHLCARQEVTKGHPPQRDHHLRLHQADLLLEPRSVGPDLGCLRGPVPWRATGDDVGDEHALPLDPVGREELVQEPAGAADERRALAVFVRARGFAHEHQLRRSGTHTSHDLGPLTRELAARAAIHRFEERL